MRKSSPYTICITFKLGLHILSCMNDARKIKDLKIFVHLSTLIGGVHNWVVSSSAYLIGILVVTAHLSIKTCLLDRAKSYRNQYYISIHNTEKLMIMYMRSFFSSSHWQNQRKYLQIQSNHIFRQSFINYQFWLFSFCINSFLSIQKVFFCLIKRNVYMLKL